MIEFITDIENELKRRINDNYHWDPNDVHEVLKNIANNRENLMLTVNGYDSLDKSPNWEKNEEVLVLKNVKKFHKWFTGKINDKNLFSASRKTVLTDLIIIMVTIKIRGPKTSINFDYSTQVFTKRKQSTKQKKFLCMAKGVRSKWEFHDVFKTSPSEQTNNPSASRKRKQSEPSSMSPPRKGPRTRSRSKTPVPLEASNVKKSLASDNYSRFPKGKFSSSQDSSSQEKNTETVTEKAKASMPASSKSTTRKTKVNKPGDHKSAKPKKSSMPGNSKSTTEKAKVNKPSDHKSAKSKKSSMPGNSKSTTEKAKVNKPSDLQSAKSKKSSMPASQPAHSTIPKSRKFPTKTSASQPCDRPDDESSEGSGDEEIGKYFFVYDHVDSKLLVRRQDSSISVTCKKIADEEISESCYSRKALFPTDEERIDEFYGFEYTQTNIAEKVYINVDKYRWIMLDEEYIVKSKSVSLRNLKEDLLTETEIYCVPLMEYQKKWVPIGMFICESPYHPSIAFRTWRSNRNFKTSKSIFDGEAIKSHLYLHDTRYRQARDAEKQLQNQMNVCQALEKTAYRFFSQDAVLDLFKLVGKLARRDRNYMTTMMRISDWRKLKRNAVNMCTEITEVSFTP